MESLTPRVRALAGLLCRAPVSEGDVGEGIMGKGPGTVRLDFPTLEAGSDIRGSLGNWKISVKIWFCCQNKGGFRVSDKPGGLIEGIHGAMMDY